MYRSGICGVCGNWAQIAVSVVALVLSMGTRADRVQRSSLSLNVCDDCLQRPRFTKLLRERVWNAAKEVTSAIRTAQK
jgi:hypothetical protein